MGGGQGHRQGQLWHLLQEGYQGEGKEEAPQSMGAGTVLKQERLPGNVEAPGQVTQPGQQRQTGHKVKGILTDTG